MTATLLQQQTGFDHYAMPTRNMSSAHPKKDLSKSVSIESAYPPYGTDQVLKGRNHFLASGMTFRPKFWNAYDTHIVT
jgi:hypothetical protein